VRRIAAAAWDALEPAAASFGLRVELRQPAQRAQAGYEAVLAAAVDHEGGRLRHSGALQSGSRLPTVQPDDGLS
jgi:hypothetical protein